jgi:hypothetical protein
MSKDGNDQVIINRESDGETFEAQIKDENGGIGSSGSSFFVIGTLWMLWMLSRNRPKAELKVD